MKTLLILFILATTLSSFFQTEKREIDTPLLYKPCDSATIIFKNVSKHNLKRVRATIKGQMVEFNNLKPDSETPPFKVCVVGTDLFRFNVYKDNLEDKDTVEPIDYLFQLSKEKIKTGTYVYYIGYDKDNVLDISLKRK